MSEVHLYTTGPAFETAKETLVYTEHWTMTRSDTARGVVRASHASPDCKRRPWSLQGYFAHKEALLPWTLQWAFLCPTGVPRL